MPIGINSKGELVGPPTQTELAGKRTFDGDFVAFPVCQCGHRHDHHRHHGYKKCYSCQECRGYDPRDREREEREEWLIKVFVSLQKVRNCLDLTVPEMSVKLVINETRIRVLPYLGPGRKSDSGYVSGKWVISLQDTDDYLMHIATGMLSDFYSLS